MSFTFIERRDVALLPLGLLLTHRRNLARCLLGHVRRIAQRVGVLVRRRNPRLRFEHLLQALLGDLVLLIALGLRLRLHPEGLRELVALRLDRFDDDETGRRVAGLDQPADDGRGHVAAADEGNRRRRKRL